MTDNIIEVNTLKIEDAKKGAKPIHNIKPEVISSDEKGVYAEYKRAQDHSSAFLYKSISLLITLILWGCAIGIFLVFCSWAYLEYTVTFDSYDDMIRERIHQLISKLESVFNYILTAGVGYAGGIARTFFHKEND